jgi:lysophospholipase L1-like esterase
MIPAKDQFRISASGTSFSITITAGFVPESSAFGPLDVLAATVQLQPNSTSYIYLGLENEEYLASTTLLGTARVGYSFIGQVVTNGTGAVSVSQPESISWSNDANTKSIVQYGGNPNGSTDNRAALLSAVGAGNLVRLPQNISGDAAYYMSSIAQADVSAVTIDPDPGVSISANASFGPVTVTRPLSIIVRDAANRNLTAIPAPNPRVKGRFFGRGNLDGRVVTALLHNSGTNIAYRKTPWTSSDTYTTSTPGSSTANTSVWTGEAALYWYGTFVSLGIGETLSGVFTGVTTGGLVGITVRGSTASDFVWSAIGDTNQSFPHWRKINGVSLASVENCVWPGQGSSNTSFNGARAIWSATRLNATTVVVKVNGRTVTRISAIGSIFEVGLTFFHATTTIGATIRDVCVEKTTSALGLESIGQITVFGDSTSSSQASDWTQHINDVLRGEYGQTVVEPVINSAVSGATTAAVTTTIGAYAGATPNWIVLTVGVNNIQNQTALATYESNVTSLITAAKALAKSGVVVVIPPQYYTQALGGGTGHAPVNHELGASYRQTLKRLAAQNTCYVWDPNEEIPIIDPATAGTSVDPLYDNLHQNAFGYQLYADGIARTILSAIHQQRQSDATEIDPLTMSNSWTPTSGVPARIHESASGMISLAGNFLKGTTYSSPQTVFTLPRWARPAAQINVPVVYQDASTGQAVATAVITSAGVVQLYYAVNANLNNFSVAVTFAKA